MLALGLLTLVTAPTLRPPSPQAATADRSDIVRETVTDDGLRIWSFPDDGADRFLLMVLVGSGARHEDPANSGLAHLLEHVVLASTETQSKADANRALKERNAQFNGWTNHDLTTYYIMGSSNSWEFAVDWLADHVVHPALNETDLKTEQAIVYEELDSSQPHAGVTTFEERLYPDHPLGQDIGGAKEAIAKQTTADLRGFYETHYRAPNMAIGFAGRVPHDEVVAAIQKAFADLPAGGELSSLDRVKPAAVRAGREGLGSPTQSGWILTGYHLPAGGATDTAVQLRLQDYLSDRAFAEIRETRQLSYDPAVELKRYADTVRLDYFIEYSSGKNLPTILQVIEDLAAEAKDPTILSKSRSMDIRPVILRANNSEQLSESMTLAWFMRRAGLAPQDLADAYDSVTASDIAAYAQEHLTQEHQFAISNSRLTKEPARPLAVAITILIALAVFDGLRGFPWSSSLRDAYYRMKARRAQAAAQRATPAAQQAAQERPVLPFRPVSGDELEKSIQRFYAEVDQDDQSQP